MKKQYFAFFLINVTAGLLMAQGDFQKGVSYYKQEQYAKAITEFEQIVKSFPDYESGQRILGDCYLKIKNYNKAIPAFQKALQIKNNNYFFLLWFGSRLLQHRCLSRQHLHST